MNDILFMAMCLIPMLLMFWTGGSILNIISNAIKSIWEFLSTLAKWFTRDEDYEREVKEMERFLHHDVVKSQPIKEDSRPSFSKFDID